MKCINNAWLEHPQQLIQIWSSKCLYGWPSKKNFSFISLPTPMDHPYYILHITHSYILVIFFNYHTFILYLKHYFSAFSPFFSTLLKPSFFSLLLCQRATIDERMVVMVGGARRAVEWRHGGEVASKGAARAKERRHGGGVADSRRAEERRRGLREAAVLLLQ